MAAQTATPAATRACAHHASFPNKGRPTTPASKGVAGRQSHSKLVDMLRCSRRRFLRQGGSASNCQHLRSRCLSDEHIGVCVNIVASAALAAAWLGS